ncbi:hypothetical protein H5410_003372 [Solanum commersonii]|uniref:Uncharacterized protein n=1 Tax=Solanum commersonii TaxID=4109 RepID=A0A9J6B5G7_SOLCO|nr:hypothetical protein H5410_003372 [Solanum commersonii]
MKAIDDCTNFYESYMRVVDDHPRVKCSKICAVADHSVQLVEIADKLGDSPFGRFHCLLALAFNFFALRVVGRYSTTSRNYSPTRRVLHFITILIFPFRAQYTGTKGDLQADRRLTNWAQRSSGLHFFVLFSRLIPSCQTQFTHVRINCVPKDSSCDTPLPKILKLAILASNASSSSTKPQQDAKSSHIVYTTSFGFIVAAHSCSFDYENYSTDHSAQLVEIVDTLDDLPFGRFHCLLPLAFNFFVLRVLPCSFLPSSVHALPPTPNT